MRNVQLAVLALPISYVTMMILVERYFYDSYYLQANDGKIVQKHGMLYGYDQLVWLIVYVYALGGLTVAVVIKYADNILKGFATSAAIVVSCVASVFLFDFIPSTQFLFGTFLVMAAIYVYSKYPHQQKS
uniref:Nucleotide-sugar transporter n=1 Tax=Romanomermis culicivorax TaxID=13658 RepID=A0A915I769_ROMCU